MKKFQRLEILAAVTSNSFIIRGGHLICPATGRDEIGDLYIKDGKIAPAPPPDAEVIDASGLIVAPGFWDLHVHLREPGGEEDETVETGSRAAARGGFTTIVAMPNTTPAHDNPETVAFVRQRGAEVALARVLPSGALTRGRAGRELTDFAALKAAGACALTDDGSTVQDDAVMESAMRAAAAFDLLVMDHAQDRDIERQGGVMHEGEFSRRFGLPGIPTRAEERIIRRDIELARRTGCRLHIQHVTSAAGVAALREGRAAGVRVTGELTPHHLVLCDADIDPANANYKMNPPLRSAADRAALTEAICDGTLSCFATDHAPHRAERKALGFGGAPFGIVGLETAVGVTFSELVATGRMSALSWIRKWTAAPAAILGRAPPSLAPGHVADVVILDVASPWRVDAAEMATKSKNTPFIGRDLRGRAVATFLGGAPLWISS